MSVIAKLYFDGGERTLLTYNFQVNKYLGSNGHPSFLKEMIFNVSFYPEKGDEFFYRWVLNKSEEPQRVKIVLYDVVWKRVVEQHEIIYSTGVKFESEFDHQLGTINHLTIPALTLITNEIYYTDIRFGGYITGEFERQKEKQTDTSPRIIDYYLTDKNQNIFRDHFENYIGEKIWVNINSVNLIGKKITLKLNKKEVDFEYQGKQLKNDILEDFEIKKDFESIELIIVQPKNKNL